MTLRQGQVCMVKKHNFFSAGLFANCRTSGGAELLNVARLDCRSRLLINCDAATPAEPA